MSKTEFSGRLTSEGFPHNYLEDALEFTCGEVEVAGEFPADQSDDTVNLVPGDRRLSLVAVPEWDEVVLGGTVSIPEKVFNGTLPYDERDDPPVKLVVAVRSPQTILRVGVTQSEFGVDVTGPGEYAWSATLRKEDLRGDVRLKPYLVRNEHQSLDEGYAKREGDRLASTESWTLRVDETREEGGFLHPRIESFERNDSFPGSEHLHYLYFEDPSTPKLYLNADHNQLVDVMQNEGTTGGDARFRDVLYDYIEQSVWQELLLRAANDIEPQSGETKYPWQEEVVELFQDDLYEGETELDEVKRRMADDATSGDDLDVLYSEIDRAIQKRVNHPDRALSLLQEGLNDD